MTKLIYSLLIFIITYSPDSLSNTHAHKELLIGSIEHPQMQTYEQLLAKSYLDIGVNVKFVSLTNERRLRAMEHGTIDGVVIALEGLEKDFPSIIKINQLLAITSTYLVCLKGLVCNDSVLNDPQSSILGTIRIKKILDNKFSSQFKAQHIMFERPQVIIDLLLQNRANFATYTVENENIPTNILLNLQTHKLLTNSAFHYLHKDFQDLAIPLKKSIAKNQKLLKL